MARARGPRVRAPHVPCAARRLPRGGRRGGRRAPWFVIRPLFPFRRARGVVPGQPPERHPPTGRLQLRTPARRGARQRGGPTVGAGRGCAVGGVLARRRPGRQPLRPVPRGHHAGVPRIPGAAAHRKHGGRPLWPPGPASVGLRPQVPVGRVDVRHGGARRPPGVDPAGRDQLLPLGRQDVRRGRQGRPPGGAPVVAGPRLPMGRADVR
mmetsp:Transcript_10355/g.35170  ORF Transcript_10355/g.35170 Transcript_10355/m.35170 type:complete len:209 (-) Transcript_10355:58-684(-)